MDLNLEALQIYGQFDINEDCHKNPLLSYEHGDELPPELGEEIFKTYRKEAKQYTLDNDFEPVDGVIPWVEILLALSPIRSSFIFLLITI